MSDEENLPTDDDLEKLPDPDTDTTGEKFPVMEAIPVADAAAPAPPPASPPVAEGAAPPRVFPQQYTMLFANVCILVGTLTVWERHHVTGEPDLYGFVSIGGAFVMAASAYCVLVGLVGLMRGGVRLASSLLSMFFALYFGIKAILRLTKLDGFQLFGDLHDKLGFQNGVNAFLSQFGPGIYLNLLGGAVILLMFMKAMFFSKKKQPEVAPRRRR